MALTNTQRRRRNRVRMRKRTDAWIEQRDAEGGIPPPPTTPPTSTGERGPGGLRLIEEMRMTQRAITGNYPITDDVRAKVIKEAVETIDEHHDAAIRLRACSVILTADAHNAKREETAAHVAIAAAQHGDDDTRREGYAAAIQSDDTRKLLTQLGERLANPGEPSPSDTIVVPPKDDTKPENGKSNGYSNGSNGHNGSNGTNGKH